jgi:hypothetical protein
MVSFFIQWPLNFLLDADLVELLQKSLEIFLVSDS